MGEIPWCFSLACRGGGLSHGLLLWPHACVCMCARECILCVCWKFCNFLSADSCSRFLVLDCFCSLTSKNFLIPHYLLSLLVHQISWYLYCYDICLFSLLWIYFGTWVGSRSNCLNIQTLLETGAACLCGLLWLLISVQTALLSLLFASLDLGVKRHGFENSVSNSVSSWTPIPHLGKIGSNSALFSRMDEIKYVEDFADQHQAASATSPVRGQAIAALHLLKESS